MDSSITTTIASFIDKWWGVLLPVALMMIFKQFIVELWEYAKLKWSDAPYAGLGNIVKFSENGAKWKIFIISRKVVCLEELDPGDPTREAKTGWAMKIPTKDFMNTKLLYRQV